jgi:hypothetical protein
MTNIPLALPADYWQNFTITQSDLELVNIYLFEKETPLSVTDLTGVLVEARLRSEREIQAKKQKGGGDIYLPQGEYETGRKLIFPALGYISGEVIGARPGANPDLGAFDVLEVAFADGGSKLFAAKLADHKLNNPPEEKPGEDADPQMIAAAFGADIEKRLLAALNNDPNLVRIAGRFFPQALLVDINQGQLNLAEAVLEVAGGEPMTTRTVAQQIELPHTDNPQLIEFSLNYALQEDPEGRFDEVGPAGQVLWILKRQEPEEVQNPPGPLRYTAIEHDRSVLNKQMLDLEAELDDELSPGARAPSSANEVTISLTYPHWRAGTLPISNRVSGLFPTAYESPRVRFTLVDAKSGEKIPAWVVRAQGYVYGLKSWFKKQNLIPGALIVVRRSKNPGEVIIEAKIRRATKDWVRTVMAGSDGGLVYAVLRQEVSCEFNERMALIVPNVDAIDAAFDKMAKSRTPLEKLVGDTLRELSKLTPQGHVHAQELYSALNLLRRVPPAPLFALLATNESFTHIGDLYFRLTELASEEA